MQIDRSNYEIWLIDWIDGNLTDYQIEHLQLFLNENPDLQEEFYEMNIFKLNSSVKSYSYKARLKKHMTDLSGSQFEYLCVAYFENDLSDEQQTELKQIIKEDPEKKGSFELFQKMRLTPVSGKYKRKNLLIKRPAGQKIMRYSILGLSVAATLAFIIINYFLIPHPLREKTINTAQNIVADTSLHNPAAEITSDKIITEKKIASITKQKVKLYSAVLKNKPEISVSNLNGLSSNDSLVRKTQNQETLTGKISVPVKILLGGKLVTDNLITLNSPKTIPEYDDGRSKLNKFIAKTFREKILKEKTTNDTPLKGYEIAEASVNGINKLFGWEMQLNKKNDEKGKLKSVYFSSKILKINAPVKKTEPLP
jgi:hypothetical protein